MNYAINFSVGTENRGNGAGETAFRYGLPLGGGGWLVRDAGTRASLPQLSTQATPLNIMWMREVAWPKEIRVSGQ
jgi:hypothetical protein